MFQMQQKKKKKKKSNSVYRKGNKMRYYSQTLCPFTSSKVCKIKTSLTMIMTKQKHD